MAEQVHSVWRHGHSITAEASRSVDSALCERQAAGVEVVLVPGAPDVTCQQQCHMGSVADRVPGSSSRKRSARHADRTFPSGCRHIFARSTARVFLNTLALLCDGSSI